MTTTQDTDTHQTDEAASEYGLDLARALRDSQHPEQSMYGLDLARAVRDSTVGARKAARWLQCHGHAEAAAALDAAITDGEITPNGYEPTESAELRRCGAQTVAAWTRAGGFRGLADRIETALATEDLVP